MPLEDALQFANDLSVIGILVLILLGGFRRWWVFGWQYNRAIQEAEDWRRLALQGTDLAEQLTKMK